MNKIEESTRETRTIEHHFAGLNREQLRKMGHRGVRKPKKSAGNLKLAPHWLQKVTIAEEDETGETTQKSPESMTNERRYLLYTDGGKRQPTPAQMRRYIKRFNKRRVDVSLADGESE